MALGSIRHDGLPPDDDDSQLPAASQESAVRSPTRNLQSTNVSDIGFVVLPLGAVPPSLILNGTSHDAAVANGTVLRHGALPLDFAKSPSTGVSSSQGVGLSHDTYQELHDFGGCETINDFEWDFWALLNEYRRNNSRSMIAMGFAPRVVAQLHTENSGRATDPWPTDCCMHSWESYPPPNGAPDVSYKQCCYNCSDSGETSPCMWDKPGEAFQNSSFQSGFEIAEGSVGYDITSFSPSDLLIGFEESPSHNDVILSNGMWSGYNWQEIGVSARGSYLYAWFLTDVTPYGYCQAPADSPAMVYINNMFAPNSAGGVFEPNFLAFAVITLGSLFALYW